MLLVFALILVAFLLFVTELLPSDTTALAVLVSLVVLEPRTGVTTTEALSGFASPATLTIVAMCMLSEGIQRTGLVGRLGAILGRITQGSAATSRGGRRNGASLPAS
jgi:di/tricarboxylate transporter